MRAWHIIAALAAVLVGAGELRLWRECAPPARALYAQHAEIALDARCDERTAKYALYYGMLDCTRARATLAKGFPLLALECVAARQPLAAYWHLLEPLLYPSRERLIEWAMAAGGVFLLVLLVTALLPQVLALRREERMHSDLHGVVGALRAVAASSRPAQRERGWGAPRLEGARRDRDRVPIVVEVRAAPALSEPHVARARRKLPAAAVQSGRIEEI